MASIVGLPGSLRRGSFNATLQRASAQMAPDGIRIDVLSLHGVTPYDSDRSEVYKYDTPQLIHPHYSSTSPFRCLCRGADEAAQHTPLTNHVPPKPLRKI